MPEYETGPAGQGGTLESGNGTVSQGGTPESGNGTVSQGAPPKRRKRSVFLYLAILFAAAFFLLLFSYLMQQRNSREILGGLNDLRDSVTSMRSLDELLEENRQLREEKEEISDQLDLVRDELLDARGEAGQERLRADGAQAQVEALLALERLERLCQTRDFEAALELEGARPELWQALEGLEDTGTPLSDELSPSQRLAAVRELLDEHRPEPEAG